MIEAPSYTHKKNVCDTQKELVSETSSYMQKEVMTNEKRVQPNKRKEEENIIRQ